MPPGDDEDFLEPLPVSQGDEDDELQDLPQDDDIGDDEDDQAGGDGGDEHSSEAGDGEADRGGAEVRPRSRATSRVERALREAREAKAEADRIRADLNAERARTQSQDQQAHRERERIALENMDPLERLDFQRRQDAARSEAQFARLEQTLADSNDKAAFAAKCARDPRLAKVADEVEAALAGSRANGVMVPRETVAAYLIGQKFMSGAPKARKQQATAGAGRVAAQQARPGTGRSDSTSRSGLSEREARRERLKDVFI